MISQMVILVGYNDIKNHSAKQLFKIGSGIHKYHLFLTLLGIFKSRS